MLVLIFVYTLPLPKFLPLTHFLSFIIVPHRRILPFLFSQLLTHPGSFRNTLLLLRAYSSRETNEWYLEA